MKGVNIFLADGFEDIEAVATIDILRRADIPVTLVSIKDESAVTSSRGINMSADSILEDMDLSADGTSREDMMIFPGGLPGASNLASNQNLIEAMKSHYAAGGSLAAICAAPGLVLGRMDCLGGVEFTCYDSFETVPQSKGAVFVEAPSVRSGRIITGRGPGFTIDFALMIVEYLKGAQTAKEVGCGLRSEKL